MKVGSIISQSTTAILANKGRSFLTILGIIIGIAAVISLYSLGQGVKENVVGNFSVLGAKTITVSSQAIAEEEEESEDEDRDEGGALGIGGGPGGGMAAFRMRPTDPTLTTEDYDDVLTFEGGLLEYATPEVNSNITINFNNEDMQFNAIGVSNNYFVMNDRGIEYGRDFSEDNISSAENIVIFDSGAAEEFSDDSESLINGLINIGDIEYKIAGILKGEGSEDGEEGAPMMRFGVRNRNIYLPYTTAMANFEQENINSITVDAVDEESVNSLAAKIEDSILENHGYDNVDDADFMVTTAQDILDARDDAISVFTNMLTGVAAISLLVGGIGIMNIMMVSVTERTQEIGLRKAVGAKTRHILIQFLTESIILTGVGGILGIVIGKILTNIVTSYVSVSAVFSVDAILLAVLVSVGTGVIFGLYPAWKASRLDPVQALRYE